MSDNLKIQTWIEHLQAKGRYSFSVDALREELKNYTFTGIMRALSRLTAKGKILSIHKGYYLIIPPQYAPKGILPPTLFIDALMKHLQRPYYVALLNAAAYHGAAHQQPQEFFIVTNFPALRPTQKKGMILNYISIKDIPEKLLTLQKTESGYLKVSNRALTASDLVQFEKRVGGLNRVANILHELIEELRPEDFEPLFLMHTPSAVLQRLGYLLEYTCYNHELANALYGQMERMKMQLHRVPLKAAAETRGFFSKNRWNVIVNTEIEIDE
ncbi:type IV toxin-antitoxin system AbiEi family antitoxin domain-containing protein [Haliscomenobacter hydrossis]|uniref:AbiEi antitoxin C-terminal domain-containing protein n=1 Tax=Haliscomenobacter hydrossis (strain ATCC 27775 / DSM 1100 / LMG 10767 / O) TaxID=760192 RepID=F4KU51_HALH1|nr:type IV toxin-antitoxin system AbiEi family antitoxin [Haliscomenobacter hydrossis]AEE50148.1 hypothetical protein Halhy_2269 [Haliscomenobacter hydrossis DSM 1100]